LWTFSDCFFNRKLTDRTVAETNTYAEEFLHRHKLSSMLTARAWKPVTEGEIYALLNLFMHMGIIKKLLRSYFTIKRVISTLGFGDIVTRDKLELICKLLLFTNIEGTKKHFNIFPVISHLNNRFQELYLPNQHISVDESLMF
jgi:hypothetical protein